MDISDARLFKLANLLFGAALGKPYYDEFSETVAEFGIAALADSWGKSSLMESELGNSSVLQASALVKRLGLDPTNSNPESGDFIAFNYFKSNLESGANPGALALAAIQYLEQDILLANLGLASNFLNNRAEVAYQYSKELEFGGKNITELKEVIVNVGGDVRSVHSALELASHKKFEEMRKSSLLNIYAESNDTIEGTSGDDYISSGAGFDNIDGGAGHDIIIGGAGNDKITGGRGQDFIKGGEGSDIIEAGSFYDLVFHPSTYAADGSFIESYNTYSVDAFHEILDGGNGNDTIYGGYGSDTITGGQGADTIIGDQKTDVEQMPHMYNDSIDGGEGSDNISGNLGNDTINGGSGADFIYPGVGQDIVHGGSGDDHIEGYQGYRLTDKDVDIFFGDEGDDTISASGGDNVDGGFGDDSISLARLNDAPQSVIVAGEGEDSVRIYSAYSDSGDLSKSVIIDLNETVQVKDVVSLDLLASAVIGEEIRGFDLNTDLIDLHGRLNIFGGQSSNASSWNLTTELMLNDRYGSLTLQKNYVQIVSDEETPWLEYSVTQEQKSTSDSYGKAYFVIQGASVASASKSDVATFLDDYGNNANYQKSASHMFLVNIQDVGIGIYRFEDDTGANATIVSDELTPVAVLTGLTTEEINMSNADFMV